MGLIKKESMRAIQAFEYYYALGDGRTYSKVAEHLGMPEGEVANIARSFAWQRRVIERNQAIALKLQKETDKQILEDQKNYRKIIQASVSRYVDNLKNNRIDINSVKDFERLVKLDIAFMDRLNKGTADELGQLMQVSNETNDTLSKLTEELAALKEPEDLSEDEEANQ